jgi:hypothetical protein
MEVEMSEEKSGSSARTSLIPPAAPAEASATDKKVEIKIENAADKKMETAVQPQLENTLKASELLSPISSTENRPVEITKTANAEIDPEKAKKDSEKETQLREQSLQRMEALLKQSAKGIHILFDNNEIAKVLSNKFDEKDFFDFQKMKRVQDVMTDLIGKKTYFEKISFLRELDRPSYDMLLRTYFHIVENTVRSEGDYRH